ncbi:MAG: stage V sporulation protein E [Patescibacteria group bacterium]|nr:MAG: stage V sporulation protein E [Patescibacteria group bacterium]
MVIKRIKNNFDWQFLVIVLILTFLGLVFIADASAPQALKFFGDRFYFVKQQVVWALFGFVFLLLFSNINYKIWSKLSVFIFAFSIFLLILVITPWFGFKALGASRRIVLGSFGFQPSELVKFSLVLYFAKLAESRKGFFAYILPLFIVCFLIMLQPDLGTTLVVAAIGTAQIFVAGVSAVKFLGLLILSSFLGFALIWFSDYRRDRLLTFLKQVTDPLGKSYHISQILISLGLGGFWGVGLGESRQKYLFLPEAATDSIFAIIAEEIGFVGSVVLIGLFLYLIYRGFKIAVLSSDIFAKMTAFGFTVWIASQAFLNLASMTSLTPLTGIPLPFISYGGSSLIMILMSAGIVLNISKYQNLDLSRMVGRKLIRKKNKK